MTAGGFASLTGVVGHGFDPLCHTATQIAALFCFLFLTPTVCHLNQSKATGPVCHQCLTQIGQGVSGSTQDYLQYDFIHGVTKARNYAYSATM